MMSILLKYYVTFSAIITVVFSVNLTNNNNTTQMEGFIVGGVETTSKNFPHAAYLHIVAVDEGNYLCGSSIVNQRVLITAAHCLEIDNLDIHVYIGNEDINKAKSVRRVNKLLVHERYDPEEVINDIALLFTSENIKFSPVIKRAIISRTFPSGPIDASVAGWGMINDFTHEVAIKLKATKQKMQVIDNCVPYSTAGMMCAGDLHSDKNRPSKGDSGSGLITSNFQLIGLVSFRIDDRPGLVIYTNVTHYLNWITKGVNKLTCAG